MVTLKRCRETHPQNLGRTGKQRKTENDAKRQTEARKSAKNKHRGYEKGIQTKIVNTGEFSEERLDGDSETEVNEVAYGESTVYDALLKTLGLRNASVPDAMRRRQKEEQGESDTEKDADDELYSESEEIEDGEEGDNGNDNESPTSYTVGNGPERGRELAEDVGIDDDDGEGGGDDDDDDYDDLLSDSDEESDKRVNDQPFSEASLVVSTFGDHLGYNLAPTEIDNILQRKWRYTWKMPVFNMSNCNWKGTGARLTEDIDANSSYGLKPRLYKHWLESYKAGSSEFHQSKERSFFSICNSYYDIMHHNKKPFYLKGLEEDSSILDAYLMHSLNHIFRSRDLMVKNDRKLVKDQEGEEGKSVETDTCRDRGFTRPKVLILLPLAGIARRVVKRLIQLTPSKNKTNVENLERFYEEFGSGSPAKDDDEVDAETSKPKKSSKPADFQALLGRDNVNDHFMIGIKFTSRGIRLYGDFYTSDMIVASPLGLITKIGEAEVDKEKDVDYLSSIEILIIDHADVILMQNWSHVNTVVEQLNKLPSNLHGTDIMRIRPWYLDEQARFYRQTIILGSHVNPEMSALYKMHCLNYRGKIQLDCKYKGVLPKIMTQARQIYERFDAESIPEDFDARFKYFCEMVFPKIKDSVQHGVMIFASSYFEYVRLRNYLKSQAASFCLFGDYINRKNISHVRGQFFRGERKIMLYTERAHFYYRYKIRGVQNLIIYSLPERKEFYPEIVNFLEESDSKICRVLFSRFDYYRLERIVGSAAAKKMVESEKGVFGFA